MYSKDYGTLYTGKKKLEAIEKNIMKDHKLKACANEMLDYTLSERFGLDWPECDSLRIQYFCAIIVAENKRHEKELKKSKNGSKNRR